MTGRSSSVKNISLTPLEDIFTTDKEREDAKREKVMEVQLAELYPFENHPFKIRDNDEMKEMVESIAVNGVLNPGIARPREGGGYELIAGHRRKHACELAGKETMPVIIRELDDDEIDDVEEQDDNSDYEIEEEKEELEKELTPDNALRSLYNETLEQVIRAYQKDGYDPPTYLDTLIVAETDRLKIREFASNDLINLWNIMRKPVVMYAWERSFKKREVKKWINQQLDRYQKDGFGYYAVTLKESGRLIGQVGLISANINGEKVVELGYIFDNSVWGHGYCIEAAKACVEMAFNHLGINKLYCTARPENEPSIKIAKKLGMMEIGEYVKVFDEKPMKHLIYILSNEI